MEKQEVKEALAELMAGHDWFYQYSDDPEAHKAGRADQARMKKMAAWLGDQEYLEELWAKYAEKTLFGKCPKWAEED